jgi:hypothetical protein
LLFLVTAKGSLHRSKQFWFKLTCKGCGLPSSLTGFTRFIHQDK